MLPSVRRKGQRRSQSPRSAQQPLLYARAQSLSVPLVIVSRHLAHAFSLAARYEAAGIRAEVAPFFLDMPARIAAAQLVVARAGASSVAELTAIGRPSILVPYPSAMDDHQTANARYLADRGAAVLMPQKELDAEQLANTLTTYMNNPEQLQQMAQRAREQATPNATADVVRACLEVAREH